MIVYNVVYTQELVSGSYDKTVRLWRVYRQRARVEMEEYQRGCSPSIVTSR